jgi:hypothetical protein
MCQYQLGLCLKVGRGVVRNDSEAALLQDGRRPRPDRCAERIRILP